LEPSDIFKLLCNRQSRRLCPPRYNSTCLYPWIKTDGTWDEKYGLYGSKGGYVVFCDGHVTWFDGSKPAKFLHWNGEKYTTDIRQALPNVAKIGNGGVRGQYSNLVIWGSGTGGT
jgi:prepilin-type processing-associated H-X9-DG protein